MPTPGAQVFQQVRQAVQDSRSVAHEADQRERACQREIEELVSQRGAAVVDLARHTLPDLRRETIQSTYSGIQQSLTQIAERKDRAIAEVEGRIQRLLEVDQQLADQRATLDGVIREQAAVQSTLEAEVAGRLQAHAEFPSLSRDAVAAEAALHQDELRVHDVESEAQEKLPAYERSALFMYLHRRGFQTEQYAERGWRRRMDRWIADMIGFSRAQRSYEFLKKTPGLMQAELDARRTRFHELMASVEKIRDQVAIETGLTAAQRTLADSQAERERLSTKIHEQRELIAKANAELVALSAEQCRFYQEALARYQSFLADTQTAVLEQQAARTPDPRDDELASRIAFLTREIERLRPELELASKASAAALEAARGLEFVERRFEQSNFHQAHSRFNDGATLETLLGRYRQGILTRDALWGEIKQQQQFERTEQENAVLNVLQHPVTHVLAEAMVQVVGAALRQGVDRSIRRREWGGNNAGGGVSLPDIPFPTWVRTNPPTAPAAPAASPIPPGGRYRTGRKL